MSQIAQKLNRLATTPHATKIVSGVAFAESSFFPLPPDLMLVPMVLAEPTRAWFLAALCSLSSVAGGVLGYFIGFFLFESIGMRVLETYHLSQEFHNFQSLFQNWGFWIILAKGVTPIPYKLVTIASGASQLNFWLFVGASLISRSLRFYILAGLTWYFGDYATDLLNKYSGWIFVLILAFIGLGFVAFKLLG
jgi:membrane protein YqaA with SNARE-associated domain